MAARILALGALRILQSNEELSVQERWDVHLVSNKQHEKQIEDYVDRDAVVAMTWGHDAETATMQ